MKFLQSLKSKLLVALVLIIACTTTIVYAEGEDTNSLTTETSEGEAVVTSSEGETAVTNSEEETSVDTSNIKEGDLYISEDSVTIDYPVSGNIYVMAKDVTIDNAVDGNVFVMAQKVTIGSKAYIYSDLFVLGDEVSINGYVYDLYACANKLDLTSSAYIIRDISASAKTVNLAGFIRRNANLSFDTINVDEDTAVIKGNLNYTSSSKSVPESMVYGEVNFAEKAKQDTTSSTKDYLGDIIKILVVSLVVILIIVLATPKFAKTEQAILTHKVGATAGYGALALIAIPIACLILFITIIGILPSIAILVAYIFFLLKVSYAIIAIPIAKLICDKMKKDSKAITILISMALVVVLWALEQIPFIGGLVSLAISIFGLGILTYAIFHPKFEITDKKSTSKESKSSSSKKDDSKEK